MTLSSVRPGTHHIGAVLGGGAAQQQSAGGNAAAGVTDTDVVISGAGPVGLSLALLLARRRVRTVVLERNATLDPHSRATLIVPRALEILDELGLLPRFLTEGQLNPAIEILRAGDHRPILTFDFATLGIETATPFALAIPQDRTEQILLDAVRATRLVEVRLDTPLHRFTADANGVSIEAGTNDAEQPRQRPAGINPNAPPRVTTPAGRPSLHKSRRDRLD